MEDPISHGRLVGLTSAVKKLVNSEKAAFPSTPALVEVLAAVDYRGLTSDVLLMIR
jgi:hypothetical protein